ncbi:MAG: nucleoside hydrolase [Chthonomonadales bacterium]
MMQLLVCALLGAAIGSASSSLDAGAPAQKVILDTDIGDDVDDAYALTLLASMPGVKLLGVTTTFGQTAERAQIAAKLLQRLGKPEIPVCAGRRGPSAIGTQYAWAQGFASRAIQREDAVEFMRRQIEANPGEVTLIAIGPLVNLGDLLTRHPEVKAHIRQIVIMGGAVYQGYDGGKPTAEWNIRCDPAAAKVVFQSGVPLTMAGLEATAMLKLEADRLKRLYSYGTPATDALAALTYLWGRTTPVLYDPMAVAYGTGHVFCRTEHQHVEVEDDGTTRITPGTPNVTVLVDPRKDEFLDWYVSAVGMQTGGR